MTSVTLDEFINNDTLSKYNLVIILSGILFNGMYTITNDFIKSTIVVIIVIYLFIFFKKKNTEAFLEDIDSKILDIDQNNKFKFLYKDPNLVEFIWRHREYYKYSSRKFEDLLKSVDVLLQVKTWSDTAYDNTVPDYTYVSDFNVAEQLVDDIVNYFISFELNLPKDKFAYQKHVAGITRIRILTKRILDGIFQKETTKRRFIDYHVSGPKPKKLIYTPFDFI